MMDTYETYDDVRARLDEIVDAVNAEGVTLDEALALYEEAVKLGLLACDLSEEDAQALVAGDGAAADAGSAEGAATHGNDGDMGEASEGEVSPVVGGGGAERVPDDATASAAETAAEA